MTEDGRGKPVLDPDQLDITRSEYVRALGEDRYVVSAGEGPPRVPDAEEDGSGADADSGAGDDAGEEVDAQAVRRWLAASLADDEFAYGFDATATFEGETTRRRMASDDVTATFEALVRWFAGAAAGEHASADEALGILLAGMDAPVTVPEPAVRRALARYDLAREDTIDDLLSAMANDDGFTIE